MSNTRTFLFLQGPHGSFFPRLGRELVLDGHNVRRINFNGGDAAIWPEGTLFRGAAGRWPAFVSRTITRHGITDLVLYGDMRPRHTEAIDVAHAAGLRVHVFEEGYIRPDWVTLERDGVNGRSALPRDPAWYRASADRLPRSAARPPLSVASGAREWAALFYYLEILVQHWRFPLYTSHRPVNPVRDAVAYVRRFFRRPADRVLSRQAAVQLAEARYFLLPLQLSSDYQIRAHSPFVSMEAAVRHVLSSFASHAPAETVLAIKEHPLDVGILHWRSLIDDYAAMFGLTERVVFLEEGQLEELILRSSGVVTVNSTSGTLALTVGKPVKVLGNAVYDMANVTDQQPLDSFWANPVAPDRDTYRAFARVLEARCLLHGSFLGADLDAGLVEAAAEKLTGG